MRHMAPPESNEDRFRDLTDDLLWHVLSFLPDDDALQTCVLSPRWRDLWRRSTSLRFILDSRLSFPTSKRFEQLAKLIINLRGTFPLTKCEIDACEIDVCPDDYVDYVELRYIDTRELLWEYALNCQVEELLFGAGAMTNYPLVLFMPISQHLKILHLKMVEIELSTLSFSGCQVLEELRMEECNIYGPKIACSSLKRFCMTGYCIVSDEFHIRISAPNLISLQLEGFDGFTPFLEDMPLLETARVELGNCCKDICYENQRDSDSDDCACHAYPDEGVLLNGLSNAINLELIADPELFIYRWDLAWCPIFGKLKTLILNEWFTATDLVCILQQSPALKKLTLKLGNTENFVEATISQKTIEQPIVCVCLLVVEIECGEVDQGVRKILKILSICGILDKQISIKNRQSH